MSERILFTPYDLAGLDSVARMQRVSELYQAAEQAGDEAQMVAIAEWASSCEDEAVFLPLGFQFFCLQRLLAYYIDRFSASADGSEEELEAERGIFGCLWNYKVLISTLPCDLSVDKAMLDEANQAMAEHYRHFGFSLSAYYKSRMEQAAYLGDKAAVKRYFSDWQAATEDESGDCEACVQSSLVEYYHFMGEYKTAVRLFGPIASGEMSCGEVPHITYYPAIDSLIRLQRNEEAAALLDEAVTLISSEMGEFVRFLPQLIQLKTRLGLHQEAQDLLDEYREAIVDAAAYNTYTYLQYLLAVAPYSEEALQAAQKTAAELDRRNGSDYYQTQTALLLMESMAQQSVVPH